MQPLRRMLRGALNFLAVVLLLANMCLKEFPLITSAAPQKHKWNIDYGESLSSTRPGALPVLDEFSAHTVIRPQVLHENGNNVESTLDNESGLHMPRVTLSYIHRDQRVFIDLRLNEDFLPDKHFLRYQNATAVNGYVVNNFNKTDVELCHYKGFVRGRPDSNVAVSTCNGINGVVFDGLDTYFIHSGMGGGNDDDGGGEGGGGRFQDQQHLLLRHSDMFDKKTFCGYRPQSSTKAMEIAQSVHEDVKSGNVVRSFENHIRNFGFDDAVISRHKRSYDDNNVIRGPYNANKHSSYVELVIVVDNKVYKSFGESMRKVHHHCKDLANVINALYVPLNIFVALVGVVIWNESNEIEFSSDGDVTLGNFLHYRRMKLVLDHPNDNAQLLTKEKFNGGVVGKALKGPICTHEFSGGVSMEHSQIFAVVATTMAHEMGHNFGMEHDSPDCKCQDEKCIMSASSTSVVPVHWSSCSIDQLNIAFSRGMNYCLRNKPTKLFDSPECGNGFVEPGEQCDCGLPSYCENTCCDPYTCLLHANASCATGECCDLATCRPKVAGAQCRVAENDCDLPEYCTGESEYCPLDVFRRDTEPCDGGNAFCYQGNCRSHTNQCRILWGPTGESSDHCYKMNADGKRNGNCGYNRLNKTFIPCKVEDVACGILHCRHLNERLEFGMESAAVLAHSYIRHAGNIVPCRTALVDLGLQSIDPGLTPNGAKCGDQRMCIDQKCLTLEQVLANGMGKECPEHCNGNGVCNSRGNCHCDVGFTGIACLAPGAGGSVDSGPATNPNSHDAFQRFMYILFFAVIPFMIAFCFFMCYCRGSHPFFMGGKLTENIIKSAGDSKQTIQRSIHGEGSAHPGSLPKSTPSSTDDMNSALLKSPNDGGDVIISNGMFGKFKGFTLRPLNDNGMSSPGLAPNIAFVHPISKGHENVPQRMAPPLPSASKAATARVEQLPAKHGSGHAVNRKAPAAPALPPPNPGTQARPIISLPVLETSTCTHTNSLSLPLPARCEDASLIRSTALQSPPQQQQSGLKLAPAPPVPLHADPKLNVRRDGTIRRIASFLNKKEDKHHPVKEKAYIDREKLKNIEISAPMPMATGSTAADTSNSDSEQQLDETKNLVKRTQSMRSPSKKANIPTFGSMRNSSGVTRPKSVVSSSSRPKSPPPRPPPLKKTASTTSSGYQMPLTDGALTTADNNTYDDCEFVEKVGTATAAVNSRDDSSQPKSAADKPAQSSDEIYSVIEELPPPTANQTPKRNELISVLSSASNEGTGEMGLLREIVSEIEKRNGDSSFYTATALSKAKQVVLPKKEPKTPSIEYEASMVSSSGAGGSSGGGSGGSGYLRSAPLNAPIARVAPTRSDLSPVTAFSSFKPPTVATGAAANATFASSIATIASATPPVAVHQSANFGSGSKTSTSASTTAATATTATTTALSKRPAPASSSRTTSAAAGPIVMSAMLPQKPKPPLTCKPSSSAVSTRRNVNVAGSRLGRAPSTTSSVASKFSSSSSPAPRPAPVIKSSNIAALQQRFESGGNGGDASSPTPTPARK